MADNTILNLGSGGDTIATDDIGGIKYQIVKPSFGPLDTATAVTATVGLPTDPLDRALRDCGKIDIAAFDVALPAGSANIGDVDVLTLPAIFGANTISDTFANPTNAVPEQSFLMGWNGTTWDRLRTERTSTDVHTAITTTNVLQTIANLYVYNGTTWDRVRGDVTDGLRAQGSATLGNSSSNPINALLTGAYLSGFNGTTWDRLNSAGNVVDGVATVSLGTLGVRTFLYGFNGTTFDRLRSDITNGLDVDVTRLPALVAGTANIGDVDVLTLPPLVAGTANIGDVDIVTMPTALVTGDIAHDAADAGSPVKLGGFAVIGGATPTSVAASDRVRWIFNQHGIPFMLGGHPNLITREFDFGAIAQTDLNLAAAAVAADERIYVTRFEALCDNANTANVSCRVGFGAVSVPVASATGVSGMIASHPGIAAGSGVVCGSGAGIIAIGALGEEPRLTSSVATSGNLHVIISYFLVDETP